MTDRGGEGKQNGPLRLHAVEGADLDVVSAALQGAVVLRRDMNFAASRRQFAFVCNRFRWEQGEIAGASGGSRIRAGVSFNDISAVRAQGVSKATPDTVMELLSVRAEQTDPPAATITLSFAGGGTLELVAGCIDVLVDDMGRPWYTPHRPAHDDDSQDAKDSQDPR